MKNFETASIDVGIVRLLDNYFDVMHEQDMDLFDEVFHQNSCLYSTQGNQLVIRPYATYRAEVAERQSPRELGNARRDHILFVDQLSSELAMARVELQMFGGVMQDYLNLVKLDDKWWVMAKLYERVGDAN